MLSKTLVILASSSEKTQLELDILSKYESDFLRLRNVPKGLLPVSGRAVLSWWYDYARQFFGAVYIITNAYNFKSVERWASSEGFPRENILNCGISNGVLSDLAFAHRVKPIETDLVITTPDLLCDPDTINLKNQLIGEIGNFFITSSEKLPVAFGLCHDKVVGLDCFIESQLNKNEESKEGWEALAAYAGDYQTHVVSGDHFQFLNHAVTLDDYLKNWIHCLDHKLEGNNVFKLEPLNVKAHARVGLMGNPSDGFYGKTMSLLISNFWAEVTLIPNQPNVKEVSAITILPNPVSDPHKFPSMECLVAVSQIDGYEAGDRLLQACCKVFYSYCREHSISINTKQGFRMMFETNIPRQVGLAGSSAIVTALWKSLMQFYNVTTAQIPFEIQASLVLDVEQEELGIAAGLQDRVIQAFGGLVYMDFDREYVEKNKHGKYSVLDVSLLPKLWLAYVADPEDSGKVHSTVKQRFKNGDQEIIDAMKQFASFTEQARESLLEKDHSRFAELMSANFNLRREVYGDAVVGAANLRMIELARQHGSVAKFPGSGGAVVGMWNGSDSASQQKDLLDLRRALEKEGYVFLELTPKAYA